MATLVDFLDRAAYIFTDDFPRDPDIQPQTFTAEQKQSFEQLAGRLEKAAEFSMKATEEVFRAVVAELGISADQLIHPTRMVLTGASVGPGLFETMAVLGKEKTVQRLKNAAIR